MNIEWTPGRAALTGALVGLVRGMEGLPAPGEETLGLLFEGVKALDADEETCTALTVRLHKAKDALVPDCARCANPCGRTADWDLASLDTARPEVRAGKLELLEDLLILAREDRLSGEILCESLYMLGYAQRSVLLEPVLEKLRAYLGPGAEDA